MFIYLFVHYLRKEDADIVDYINITRNNKVGIETFNANNIDGEEEKKGTKDNGNGNEDFEIVDD